MSNSKLLYTCLDVFKYHKKYQIPFRLLFLGENYQIFECMSNEVNGFTNVQEMKNRFFMTFYENEILVY